MSESDFNRLVDAYLDRSATATEVVRLREMLMASPELTRRFKQREKLHRVQVKYLAEHTPRNGQWLTNWLMNFTQRFNRTASYVCLLLVVLVQTRVSLDSDYKGLSLYVIKGLVAEELMVADDDTEPDGWFELSAGDFESQYKVLLDVADEDEDV